MTLTKSSDLELTNIIHFSSHNQSEKRRLINALHNRPENTKHRFALGESLAQYERQICGFLTYDSDKQVIQDQVKVLREIGEKVFGVMAKSTLDWSDEFSVSLFYRNYGLNHEKIFSQ